MKWAGISTKHTEEQLKEMIKSFVDAHQQYVGIWSVDTYISQFNKKHEIIGVEEALVNRYLPVELHIRNIICFPCFEQSTIMTGKVKGQPEFKGWKVADLDTNRVIITVNGIPSKCMTLRNDPTWGWYIKDTNNM